MSSLLLTIDDSKLQSAVTINGNGIYYQEFRLGDRPMSQRVKLGRLDLIGTEVTAVYDEWLNYDATRTQLSDVEKLLSAMPEGKEKASYAKERDRLADSLVNNPLHRLELNSAVSRMVDKLINSAKFKHQMGRSDVSLTFTFYETHDSFMLTEARALAKRYNEAHPDHLMALQDAEAIVAERYTRYLKASGRQNVSPIAVTT
jgi:hypothetical protein